MIITGQQPAVGGGPLYTLVKAAHAVALARQRAVPAVFWCASEDHDLGEAGHADVVLRNGTIKRLTVDLGPGRASLRFRPAVLWWDAMLAHLQQHVGPGLGADFLHAHAPINDEGMGAWLCRLIAALFPGMQAIEGHTLRPRFATALERAVQAWPTVELAALRARLLATGAADAFGELAEPPLFADTAAGRTPLSVIEARAYLAAGKIDEVSPGAALRPILQQAALPCTVYVGGPGELAYHRFIMPLYSALGVTQPELLPRCSLTLVPSWCARACVALGGSAEDLSSLRDLPPRDDAGSLAAFDELLTRIGRVPNFSGSQRRLVRERRHLARRLSRQAGRAAGLPSAHTLRAYLQPRGARQERSMSLFQAIWEHGPGLAQQLVTAAHACAPGDHRLLNL